MRTQDTHRHTPFLPQLNSCFQLPPHQVEFVEELMRILSYLTFHVVPTPEDLFRCGALKLPGQWRSKFLINFRKSVCLGRSSSLFIPLCELLTSQYEMVDWLDELSMPLGNFIANGTAQFLSEKRFIDHYYQACSLASTSTVRLSPALAHSCFPSQEQTRLSDTPCSPLISPTS